MDYLNGACLEPAGHIGPYYHWCLKARQATLYLSLSLKPHAPSFWQVHLWWLTSWFQFSDQLIELESRRSQYLGLEIEVRGQRHWPVLHSSFSYNKDGNVNPCWFPVTIFIWLELKRGKEDVWEFVLIPGSCILFLASSIYSYKTALIKNDFSQISSLS